MATPPMPVITNPVDQENARQFQRDFPDIRPNEASKGKGKAAQDLERRVRELHTAMKAMQPPFATVVNMNPFPIRVTGPCHDGLVLPPCPEGADYGMLVIVDYAVSVKDLGDANYQPTAEPPMRLAYDFEAQTVGEDGCGGVFYIPGEPSNLANLSMQVRRIVDPQGNTEDVTIGALFERARSQMLVQAERLYNEAETEWHKPNGQRNIISERHRRGYLVLHRFGRVVDKPAWMNLTRAEANLGEKCPACGKQLQKGVIKCNACPYFLDIEKGWALGMVERSNPQLRLLGPDKLVAIGLSDEEITWLCPGWQGEAKADASEPQKKTKSKKDDKE